MFHRYRPMGRFFCWIAMGMFLLTMSSRGIAATAKTTRVTDTVYRADGTPAKGTLLISWPAFTAASGEAVAAGRATIAIGAAGQVDLPLVANTGSAPASYYTVVLQLDDGATATEYWTVPSAASTTIAAIRSKIVPVSVAVQVAGRDYVDSALAAKATDTAVVHYAGAETISGVKTFVSNPIVPTPTADTHAVNKIYVDSAVQSSQGFTGVRQADRFDSIQSAIDDAGTSGAVVIPPGYAGQESFTNPNARTVIDLRRIGDARGGDISIKDFGARGDGGWYGYTHCTSGSAVISNVAVTVGRLPKVGDQFVAAGCGVAGADLQCTLSAASGTQYGTVMCGGGIAAAATLASQGARWGTTVDDTAAFSAAFAYCATAAATGGCKVKVPGGVYFVSNVTFPAKSGSFSGQITLEGMGRTTSWIIGTGADETAIFTAPASSVPTAIKWLGFRSYDGNNKKQIAVGWLGGQYHDFSDNDVYGVYEMIRASNTWENSIQRNRCYGAANCIHFGPAGLGPVNATAVTANYIDSEFSGVGILSDATGSGGSQQNYYLFNTIQNDNPPFVAAVDLNDNGSKFFAGYDEFTVGGATSGYNYIFRGSNNEIHSSYLTPCMQLAATGGANSVYLPAAGFGCSGQTYIIRNDSTGNRFFGNIQSSYLSALNSGYIYGAEIASGPLTTRPYSIGGAYDWANGRVDIAGVPHGSGATNAANPSAPTGFGTAAVIPSGTIIKNTQMFYIPLGTQSNNVFWICANASGCSANPITASDWRRFGETSNKIRQEGTAAPTGNAWTVGDFIWNTNPAGNGILGWICTVAGTPGTWTAVYAAPPLLNSSGTVQLGAHQVIGSATLTSASPSTVTVTLTGGAVFTSNTSYKCALSNQTAQANAVKITYSSGSSFVITGPNTVTDVIGYVCTGN